MKTNKKEQVLWRNKKGNLFEDLVEILLTNMFPHLTFKHTEYVADGGKDFYTTDQTNQIWVEAKNYTEHLELSKFANTFIMADLSQINHLIIFSMSELTNGARLNSARYAAYHHKSISIYDGNNILLLIDRYREYIDFSNFFANIGFINNKISEAKQLVNSNNNESSIEMSFDYYITKQLDMTYRREKESRINTHKLSVPLNSKISQEIIVYNTDLFKRAIVRIDKSNYDSNYFECLGSDEEQTIELPPAAITVVIKYFKLIGANENIVLPSQKIIHQKKEVTPINKYSNITCHWLGEIPYFGDGWEKLNELKNRIDDNSIDCAVVRGKSGVGKSRFLQESAQMLFEKNFRVIMIDFHTVEKNLLKNVIKQILCHIFCIEFDSNQTSIYKKQFQKANNIFYRIVYDDKFDCIKYASSICGMLFGILQRKRIALLFDNIQDVKSDVLSFFRELNSYLVKNNQSDSFIVYCVNEDFLLECNGIQEFLESIINRQWCFDIKLNDYSPKDAALYLKECLDPLQKRNDMSAYIQMIIEKFGFNPFTLKQVILFLLNKKIIQHSRSIPYIADHTNMISALDELPCEIDLILNCRYKYMIKSFGYEPFFKQIAWCALFFSGIDMALKNELDFNEKCFDALVGYGFMEYDESSKLIFSHQLIEKFFCLKTGEISYSKKPKIQIIRNRNLLKKLLDIVSQKFNHEYCVQEMILRYHLFLNETEQIHEAMKLLQIITPSAIMIPLILNTFHKIISSLPDIDAKTEISTAYALCVSTQARYDNFSAAKLSQPMVEYEQSTYHNKTIACKELVNLFKHYTFLLPPDKKTKMLEWMQKNSLNFGISAKDQYKLEGWICDRLCKNYTEKHSFDAALKNAQKALEIATANHDYIAMAEAEIEFGNIYAYFDADSTAEHWDLCVKHLCRVTQKSPYEKVYHAAYSVLVKILREEKIDYATEIKTLENLRKTTFLYQQLLIDDIIVDLMFLLYSEKKDIKYLMNSLYVINRMKDDSYMYNIKFTYLAIYKHLTALIMIDKHNSNYEHQDLILTLMHELIDNHVFEDKKLMYSSMIISDIAQYCYRNLDITDAIRSILHNRARELFDMTLNSLTTQVATSQTVLHDRKKTINLLPFNFVF